MTVVVTRDVSARYRGFLASCMLEIAPGVYTAPRMNRRVRERLWQVLQDWHTADPVGGVVMTWFDSAVVGGQGISILGSPAQELLECQGVFLARNDGTPEIGEDL